MSQKLIIAFLGTSKDTTRIEQHNLFFGIGESFKDPKIIEEMKEFWPASSHIDDVVLLVEMPWFEIEAIENSESIDVSNEYTLYAVWIGWYEKEEPWQVKGMYELLTEKHKLLLLIVKNPKEIHEKLMYIKQYADGQLADKNALSHEDNRHALVSDIDNQINVSELIKERGFQIRIVEREQTGPFRDHNVAFHGYGKYTKLLKDKGTSEYIKSSSI